MLRGNLRRRYSKGIKDDEKEEESPTPTTPPIG